MKSFTILSVLTTFAVANGNMYYTTGNDYLDVDAIMKDPGQINNYMNCFTDRGTCDPLMASYKKYMPDAVPTACQKCNNAQKHLWNRFLQGLKSNYPTHYAAFQQKYDPKHVLLAILENAVANY